MDFQLLNKTVCLCGKRHSGKSELIKYIVSLYRHQFNKIFVVCPSEAVNKFYSSYHLKTYSQNIKKNRLINKCNV